MGYHLDLIRRFWDYRQRHFAGKDDWFDRPSIPTERPPVFLKNHAEYNVLTSEKKRNEVINEIDRHMRHRWFGSMKSSQALGQSVFGNLKAYGKLHCLEELRGDDGKPLFIRSSAIRCSLEFEVCSLGEPRKTRVDVFLEGTENHCVAVECKLAESGVGPCSRPRLKKHEPGYCSGDYALQKSRSSRCSLTEIGVRYWDHVPKVFDWSRDVDHTPCPLRNTYQIVRNLLAACVRHGGEIDSGHAVLVYDERNLAFRSGGDGMNQWTEAKNHLKNRSLLQKCTWQQIVRAVRERAHELSWLTDALTEKYGL